MECELAKIENQGARLARTPTLDAKHLWSMNLEDLCYQLNLLACDSN